MNMRQLNHSYAVAGQIEPSDVRMIAAMGYKSLICNRPDGEAADQVPFEGIVATAQAAGLRAEHLPIAPQGPTASDHTAFARLFDEMPKPILAYCRTGNRSALLWAGMDEAAAHTAG